MAATVLIVDDHPGFRAAARRLLELEGYVVVGEAVDGMTALDAVHELRPEVVLLDVQLPDIDGFEVAERLSAQRVHAGRRRSPRAARQATTVPASPAPPRAGSSPRPSSRPRGSQISCPREAHDRRRRRLPRPARLRRAAASGRAARPRRGRAARRRRRAAGADRAGARRARPPSTASGCRSAPRPTSTTRVEGADFVFCAIRVGQLEGRVVDEDVPLGLGVLGQETTGPGGICFALRTIPVMVELAETIAERAPGAWLINFTNPAGMVTEAVQQVLGDRAVGICDSPSGLCRRVAAALGARPERAVVRLLRPQPPRLAARRARRRAATGCSRAARRRRARWRGFEEGRLFGGEWLRSLGMIPNEYLYYFYLRGRHGRRDPAAARLARRVPARAAARVLRRQRRARRRGARRLARDPRTSASAPTWPRRAAPPATTASTTDDANGGYEGEAMAVRRGDRAQHAARC